MSLSTQPTQRNICLSFLIVTGNYVFKVCGQSVNTLLNTGQSARVMYFLTFLSQSLSLSLSLSLTVPESGSCQTIFKCIGWAGWQ